MQHDNKLEDSILVNYNSLKSTENNQNPIRVHGKKIPKTILKIT